MDGTAPSVISLMYEGRKEDLNVIYKGGDIIKQFSRKNVLCPLIDTDIKLTKMLGKGSYGAVFEITFPGKGTRKYVVKRSFNQPPKCLPNAKQYKRVDGAGFTEITKGSSICQMDASEYAISLLLGEIYRQSKCINFIDVFSIAICPGPGKEQGTYIFMEKINTSIRRSRLCTSSKSKILTKIPEGKRSQLEDSIIIQTLFAMVAYHQYYHIVHGDLHDDNIFVDSNPDLEWKGHKIRDYDYFEYKISGKKQPGGPCSDICTRKGTKHDECAYGDVSIYLPAVPAIVKIGDLGLAVKYSIDGGPMVGNEVTLADGYDVGGGNGPWLPNFYTEAYDTTHFISSFQLVNPSNKLVRKILAWIFKQDLKKGISNTTRDHFINPANRRPRIKLLETELCHVSPIVILRNPKLMGDFMKRPPTGSRILTIGEI